MKKTAPLISPENAERIKKAQLAAIANRLKGGKALTAAQQKFLDEQSQPDETQEKDFTINGLSAETGRDRHTIKKAVKGLTPTRTVGGNPRYRLEDVENALAQKPTTNRELLEERLISERLDNERKRREEAEARRELVRMDEVSLLLNNILLPIKQRFDSLPSECCSLTNPTDPKFAFAALEIWKEQANRIITEKLPTVKVGEPDQEVAI